MALKNIFLLLQIIISSLIIPTCSTISALSPGQSSEIPLKTPTATVNRSYLLHLPLSFNPAEQYPLLVALHGAFSDARTFERETGFSELADSSGFIVVYPQGEGAPFGFLRHWNAGHCCGRAAKKNRNDVDFIKQVIDTVCTKWKVDRQRIYMTGFSNGGMLVHTFAQKYGQMLAAIAPLAAPINSREDAGQPFHPLPEMDIQLPVLMMHGLLDDSLPFKGGISPRRGGTQEFASAQKSITYWAEANGCFGKPDTTMLSAAISYIWTGDSCSACSLVALKQWNHRWPGLYFTDKLKQAHPMNNFDGTGFIWSFFKKYRR